MFLHQCCWQHPAQDCVMSDWSFWSGCAKPCEPSVRVRVRRIEQQPSNSGQPCPRLEERAGCMEYRDHQGNRCGLNSGIQTTHILWFLLFLLSVCLLLTFNQIVHIFYSQFIIGSLNLNWFLSSGPAIITSTKFGKGRPKHDSYGNPLDPGQVSYHGPIKPP